jgi:WD40 repeat protein
MFAITTTTAVALMPVSNTKHTNSVIEPVHTFPTGSRLTSVAWSIDNAALFTSSSSALGHFTSSGNLQASIPLEGGAVNLLTKDKSTLLFSVPGTSKIHIISLASSGKPVQVLETHKYPNHITSLALSNDATLLASTSASTVHVHNLTLNSHTILRGLPVGEITCSAFHPHTRTKLLLGLATQLVIYDTTRPSGPLKTIPIPNGASKGHIVGITCSSFSKTLVALGLSAGYIAIVDLEKDKGDCKMVPMHAPITCLVFAPNGGAILSGTENGKVLMVDLRVLERSVCVGQVAGAAERIVGIAVQVRFWAIEVAQHSVYSDMQKKAKGSPDAAPKSAASAISTNTTKTDRPDRAAGTTAKPRLVSGQQPKLARITTSSSTSTASSDKPKDKETIKQTGFAKGKQTVANRKEADKGQGVAKKPFSPVRDPLRNSLARSVSMEDISGKVSYHI